MNSLRNSTFNNSFIAHLIAILLLPANVIGVIPYFLFQNYQSQKLGPINLNFGSWSYLLAICFLVVGLVLFTSSIVFFIQNGKGTLAPWTPTSNLVISGPYAYVRNPMISGVVSILVAEAFLLCSSYILLWAISFFIINHIYFILWEENSLRKKYGQTYIDYRANVSRWIPNIRPWRPFR